MFRQLRKLPASLSVRYLEFLIIWLKRRRDRLADDNRTLIERHRTLRAMVRTVHLPDARISPPPKDDFTWAIQVNGKSMQGFSVNDFEALNGKTIEKVVIVPFKLANLIIK